MRQLIIFLLIALSTSTLWAQTNDRAQRRHWNDAFMQTDTLRADTMSIKADSVPMLSADMSLSWNEPALTLGGYGLVGATTYDVGYGSAWRLHKGLNAQFGLSVSAAFGKHAPKGVGFGQTAAFAYLFPVSPRMSVAAGLYATNINWGAWRRTDVGFAAMMAYQLTDRINLYAYGSKTFVPRPADFAKRREPFPAFFDQPRDRFGAAAEFKIGNNAMIGVSVERTTY